MADQRPLNSVAGSLKESPVIVISDVLPNDFIAAAEFSGSPSPLDYSQLALSSPTGVRLLLSGDTGNNDEDHTARIVIEGDGGFAYGVIGHAGSFGIDADGNAFVDSSNASNSNALTIHNTDNQIQLGCVNTVALVIDKPFGNRQDIIVTGHGGFGEEGYIFYGDGFCGLGEPIDDSIRLFASDDVEIVSNGQVIVLGHGTGLTTGATTTPILTVDVDLDRVCISGKGDISGDTLLHLIGSGRGEENGLKFSGGGVNWQVYISDGNEGAGGGSALVLSKAGSIDDGGDLRIQSGRDVAIRKSLQIGGIEDAIETLDLKGRAFIEDSTEPATPTGGGILYVEGGELKFKGSSGTVTTIAEA